MKNLIIIILLFSFANEIHAQMGFRIGTNIATLNFAEEDEYLEIKSLIGLNIGALYEMQLSEKFSLQGELHFIQKGTRAEEIDYDEKFWIRFNYIDLAIMSKYYLANIGESTRLYLSATPYLGYAINGKYGEEYDGKTYSESINFKEDEIRRFDFGIGLGLGLNWNNWFLDIRYNIGLQDLDDYEEDFDDYYDYDFSVYHRGILIGIGYQF